jgi:F-type H+-transporting ATPase subunit epsilon
MSVPEHPAGALRTGNISDELAHGQVNLDVIVVSPDRTIFQGEAHWVTATGVEGQFGIWPRHAAIVVALGSGPLRIRLRDHTIVRFAARAGFLEVAKDRVTVLVDAAVAEAEAEAHVAEAERDLEETVADLAHPRTDQEFAELLDRRAWAQARLNLAKR